MNFGLIGTFLAMAVAGYIVGWFSGAIIGATWWARKGKRAEEYAIYEEQVLYELDRLTPWEHEDSE